MTVTKFWVTLAIEKGYYWQAGDQWEGSLCCPVERWWWLNWKSAEVKSRQIWQKSYRLNRKTEVALSKSMYFLQSEVQCLFLKFIFSFLFFLFFFPFLLNLSATLTSWINFLELRCNLESTYSPLSSNKLHIDSPQKDRCPILFQ